MPEEIEPSSDLNNPEYLTFGGLAVLEGVMMRSPKYYSVACRAPNGNIVVKTEPLEQTWIGKQKWLKKPFLRGTLALLDTMVLGNRAMNWAASIQTDAKYALQVDANREEKAKPDKQLSKPVEGMLILATIGLALLVQFSIFRIAPEFIAEYFMRSITGSPDKNQHLFATNYLAEVIKVVFFIGFLVLISFYPSIKELFRYHGAEHKAINTVESKAPLTIESSQAQTRLHPRCGTNFLIVVTLVAFLIFPAIPRDLFVPATSPAWKIALSRVPLQIVVFPLIAGMSYEIIRLAGKAKDAKWVNILLKPGLMTQLITTAEPEPKHLEVAIAALKSALAAERDGTTINTDQYVEDLLA